MRPIACGAARRAAAQRDGPAHPHLFIAGRLRSSLNNMTAWLEGPQRLVPGNAMPNMGTNREKAQDMTAYLYTLR